MGGRTVEVYEIGVCQGASNMAYRATDAPDLSRRDRHVYQMFAYASSFDGDISGLGRLARDRHDGHVPERLLL